jgi:hypothetical protein
LGILVGIYQSVTPSCTCLVAAGTVHQIDLHRASEADVDMVKIAAKPEGQLIVRKWFQSTTPPSARLQFSRPIFAANLAQRKTVRPACVIIQLMNLVRQQASTVENKSRSTWTNLLRFINSAGFGCMNTPFRHVQRWASCLFPIAKALTTLLRESLLPWPMWQVRSLVRNQCSPEECADNVPLCKLY